MNIFRRIYNRLNGKRILAKSWIATIKDHPVTPERVCFGILDEKKIATFAPQAFFFKEACPDFGDQESRESRIALGVLQEITQLK